MEGEKKGKKGRKEMERGHLDGEGASQTDTGVGGVSGAGGRAPPQGHRVWVEEEAALAGTRAAGTR